ncbi:hypothetical protein WA158_002247 [Blastocystis sp. Blastoise]
MELDVSALRQKYRENGRQDDQFRPFTYEKGVLSRADGSAKITIEKTIVLASVLAPKKPVKSVKENFYQATVEVNINYLNDKDSANIIENGYYIQKLLESMIQRTYFPRSTIIVNVQIISDDGSLLSSIIQAVLLALIDAEIPIKSNIYAVTLCRAIDGRYLIDPDLKEQTAASTSIILGFNDDLKLSVCKQSGIVEEQELFDLIEMGKKAAKYLQKIMEHPILN